ncbi:MAG: prepilin-type N-terminal cleavage/methylation domain-containing protein [Balneola sp.]|nr:MAG: prepilin-type N-terminal cleavage/methylation domain-containing protein [Balneola sp.]
MKHEINQILRKEDGFSLTELLIVLAIIGILIMIAVPLYQNVTTRAKTTEAKTQLAFLHTLQRVYHLEHDSYASDFSAIDFQHEKMITEGGRARYQIEIESASTTEYVATATSIIDFDNDGVFNKWQVDEEGNVEQVIPD